VGSGKREKGDGRIKGSCFGEVPPLGMKLVLAVKKTSEKIFVVKDHGDSFEWEMA